MSDLSRREFLQAGAVGLALPAAGAATAAAPAAPGAAATSAGAPAAGPEIHRGFPVYPPEQGNPLGARIVAFTIVTPDMEASQRFYTEVLGYQITEQGTTAAGASTAPGIGRAGRRYAFVQLPGSKRNGAVRLLEAPPGALPVRPRGAGGSRIWDPGLAVMEGGMRDPCESYHRLASAKTPMVSPPRYYFYRALGPRRDLDVMSYSPFGPAGEQMFLTANIRNDRPEWTEPAIHTVPTNCVIVTLDQRPAYAFYERAFGLKRVAEMDCEQPNCNELIGAPRDFYFLWGNVGGNGFSMEIWECAVPEGRVYPTSLDRTGLAMFTVAVPDLPRARAMWAEAGIVPVGQGALPVPGNAKPVGFTLRGAVGELVEVVQA